MSKKMELNDLLKMDKKAVANVFQNGYPLNLNELEGNQYLGIDLTMPKWFHKYFWRTFRKTFYRDPKTGVIRGWNVKMEQTGWEGPVTPKKNKDGSDQTFAHYYVQSAKGLKFPKNWKGSDFLNYGASPNNFGDGFAYTPLVAVNEGSMDLLIGWEVFKIGPFFIPLEDYWILRKEGPIDNIVTPPKN